MRKSGVQSSKIECGYSFCFFLDIDPIKVFNNRWRILYNPKLDIVTILIFQPWFRLPKDWFRGSIWLKTIRPMEEIFNSVCTAIFGDTWNSMILKNAEYIDWEDFQFSVYRVLWKHLKSNVSKERGIHRLKGFSIQCIPNSL